MTSIKKILKEEEERQKKIISERNKSLCDKYVAENFEEKEALKDADRKMWLKPKFLISFASSLVLIIIVVITLVIVLQPKIDNGNGDGDGTIIDNNPPVKEYIQENEQRIPTNLSILNTETAYSVFNFNLDKITKFELIYDSHFNENLYFSIVFVDDELFEYAEIKIVTNKDYHYIYDISPMFKLATINQFTVKYVESFINDSGLYSFDSQAIITTNKEIIYISYQGYAFEENSNFLNWVEQHINSK